MKKLDKPRVVGIGGSLRQGSRSRMALHIALLGVTEVDAELIDVRAFPLPLFNPDVPLSEYPSEVASFLQTIREADAFLWSAPAYHGTISGSMKNMLDYLEFLNHDDPPYLTDKAVGLISTAGGMIAAVNTITALTHVALALRAWVVPLVVPTIQAWWRVDDEGRLQDRQLLERLVSLGREVAAYAVRRKEREHVLENSRNPL